MVAVVAPGAARREVEAACARWELPCTVIGEVTDHGELRVLLRRRGRRRDPGAAAHRRVPALRDRADRRRRAAPRRGRPPGEPRAEDVGVRAVRPARRLAHRPPAGPRRGRAPDRRHARDRGVARRAAARRARPVPRRLGSGDGRGAQRRVRRRRAARAHRLPQLRQPRAAARSRWELAPGDRGHRARGRRARHPGRLRATSRSTTRPAAGRSRRRPWSAASGSSAT